MSEPSQLNELLRFRKVNQEWLAGLEIVSNKVHPLPGAVGPRAAALDTRLPGLGKTLFTPGQASVGPKGSDLVCYYEHVATVRHKATDQFFVAFRETMDALLARQKNPDKFPEWLMKNQVKKTELSIHIYRVKCKPYDTMTSHEDWLEHVEDPWVFDTLAFYLLQSGMISEQMFRSLR
jgi:hypothetical protein